MTKKELKTLIDNSSDINYISNYTGRVTHYQISVEQLVEIINKIQGEAYDQGYERATSEHIG
jgi:hypothetical protein